MTNRENFFGAIRRQGYERAMPDFILCPSLVDQVEARFGTRNYQELFHFPWRDVEDLRLIDHDTEQYRPYFQIPLSEDSFIDLWGVGHERSPNSMHMTRMRYPLENAQSVEDILNYPFPDFAHADGSHQRKQVEKLKARDLIALGSMPMTIWECSWYLRGMENLFCDMMTDEEMATCLLDKITELAIIRATSFAKAGVDVLYLGDDIGMQHTLMMSTEVYCKWLKPRLKTVIDAAKAIKPDLLVMYHSCGFIEDFIPHLIEVGVDILNPIQSECMDFREIHAKYGDRISFHGTIGTQTVMPFGTPEQVRQKVQEHLDIAGAKGGLFCAPTHMLEPEVPMENILAYVDAIEHYQVTK